MSFSDYREEMADRGGQRAGRRGGGGGGGGLGEVRLALARSSIKENTGGRGMEYGELSSDDPDCAWKKCRI